MMDKIRKNKTIKCLSAIVLTLSLIVGVFVASTSDTNAETIKGSYKGNQAVGIYYTYTQNADTCKTKLTIRLRAYSKEEEATFKYNAAYTLKCNGDVVDSGKYDYDCPAPSSYKNVSDSITVTITQKNGAKTTVPVYGSLDLSGTAVGGKLTIDKNITLPAFRPSTKYASVTVTGKIVWDDDNNRDGKRPSSTKVHIIRNGTELSASYSPLTVSSDSSTYTSAKFYKYASGGSAYTYTVKGSDVEGYTCSVSGTTITYKHTPETKTISGSVAWDDGSNRDGKRPSKTTVTLYKNGTAYDTAEVSSTSNTFSFPNVYAYENGKAITYTVGGSSISGYTSSVSSTKITYSHTPEKVKINGSITWNDGNNGTNTRPSLVEVSLLKNGTKQSAISTNSGSDWKYDFGELYKYEDGKAISYTIKAPSITEYDTEMDGYNIIYTCIGKLGTSFGFSL